jgi:hypothetical protein
MSNYVNPLAAMAAVPMGSQQKKTEGTWFEAMAQAWGQTLDTQADRIQQQSDRISGGDDTPQAITQLTALSLKMGFLSNSSHTSISAVGQALETMARKQ